MFSKKNTLIVKLIRYLVIPIEIFLILITLFNLYFLGKIYPGMYIAGTNVGGKKPHDTEDFLKNNTKFPESISLQSDEQSFNIPLKSIAFVWDPALSSARAYSYHRTGNIFLNLIRQLQTLFRKENIGISISFDEQVLSQYLDTISSTLAVDPTYPKLEIAGKEVVVEKGKPGSEADLKKLRILLGYNLSYLDFTSINIPTKLVDPTLSESEAEVYKKRAESLLNKKIILKYDSYSLPLEDKSIFKYLAPKGEYKEDEIAHLVDSIANEVNRNPQNSVFVFNNNRVEEFVPAKDGVKVKKETLIDMVMGNLRTLEYSDENSITIEIPVELTRPKIKTEDVNNLGIQQLLGKGLSYFRGSIPGRIHNISLASSRFKGILISPGDTFSFNKVLGDVSALTGYKQAYIIKDGRTILGDGGGVCQVSTTLFRAALDAGLPIVERKAHSYRVNYYEQGSSVGLDATVFEPTADLKFTNDTPGYLLIQPTFDPTKSLLIFEIYGTSDGRKSYLSKPVISGTIPPPEDLYTDDPTLPLGTIKQIDHKAWGAKVVFKYTVTRNGEAVFNKTFVSNYLPWQAVYLRGTGPAR